MPREISSDKLAPVKSRSLYAERVRLRPETISLDRFARLAKATRGRARWFYYRRVRRAVRLFVGSWCSCTTPSRGNDPTVLYRYRDSIGRLGSRYGPPRSPALIARGHGNRPEIARISARCVFARVRARMCRTRTLYRTSTSECFLEQSFQVTGKRAIGNRRPPFSPLFAFLFVAVVVVSRHRTVYSYSPDLDTDRPCIFDTTRS